MKIKKHKCCECGCEAKWLNIDYGENDLQRFYCGDCLAKLTDSPISFVHNDEGFLKKENEKTYYINEKKVYEIAEECMDELNLSMRDKTRIKRKIRTIFVVKKLILHNEFAKYNVFMSEFGDEMNRLIRKELFFGKEDLLWKFYVNLKKKLKNVKFSV